MGERTISVTVPQRLAGKRFDVALADLAQVSRSQARRLIEAGQAVVEPHQLGVAGRVEQGMRVQCRWEQTPEVQPALVELDVPYEDQHLAIVNKPAGMVVHPGAGRMENTLVSALLQRWPQVKGVGEYPRWGIVHRLDKNTSGVMVVALTTPAFQKLRAAVADRALHRTYATLVHGSFAVPTGTVDAPIAGGSERRKVGAAGKPAVTHYHMQAHWTAYGLSLLQVTLETGRTHQIRVHLEAIGHHVVGDPVYGRPGPAGIDPGRVWLHSHRLGLAHPVTADQLEVSVPLPTDLSTSLAGLGTPQSGKVPADLWR